MILTRIDCTASFDCDAGFGIQVACARAGSGLTATYLGSAQRDKAVATAALVGGYELVLIITLFFLVASGTFATGRPTLKSQEKAIYTDVNDAIRVTTVVPR